jgi:hypothetical protein
LCQTRGNSHYPPQARCDGIYISGEEVKIENNISIGKKKQLKYYSKEKTHTHNIPTIQDSIMPDQNTTMKGVDELENNPQGNASVNEQEHSQRKRKATELSTTDTVVNESKRKRVLPTIDEKRRPSFVRQKSIQVSIIVFCIQHVCNLCITHMMFIYHDHCVYFTQFVSYDND